MPGFVAPNTPAAGTLNSCIANNVVSNQMNTNGLNDYYSKAYNDAYGTLGGANPNTNANGLMTNPGNVGCYACSSSPSTQVKAAQNGANQSQSGSSDGGNQNGSNTGCNYSQDGSGAGNTLGGLGGASTGLLGGIGRTVLSGLEAAIPGIGPALSMGMNMLGANNAIVNGLGSFFGNNAPQTFDCNTAQSYGGFSGPSNPDQGTSDSLHDNLGCGSIGSGWGCGDRSGGGFGCGCGGAIGGVVSQKGNSRSINGGMPVKTGFVNKAIPTNSLAKGGMPHPAMKKHPVGNAAPVAIPNFAGPQQAPAKAGIGGTQMPPLKPPGFARGGMGLMAPHVASLSPTEPALNRVNSRVMNDPRRYAMGGIGSDPGMGPRPDFYDNGGMIGSNPNFACGGIPDNKLMLGQSNAGGLAQGGLLTYSCGGPIACNGQRLPDLQHAPGQIAKGGPVMPSNASTIPDSSFMNYWGGGSVNTYNYACGGPGLGSPPQGMPQQGPVPPEQQAAQDPDVHQAMANQSTAEQIVPKEGTADNVDAKVSKGEFVMDAATVMYYGMGKFVQMQEKAHEEIAKHLAKQSMQQQQGQQQSGDQPPPQAASQQPPGPPQKQGLMGPPPQMPNRLPAQAVSPPNATQQRIQSTNTPHGGNPFSLMG